LPPRQSPAAPEPPASAADRTEPPAPESARDGGSPGRGPASCDPRTPSEARRKTGAAARPAEGPMALAFRLAREKKQQME
jgi:hypothetical protein